MEDYRKLTEFVKLTLLVDAFSDLAATILVDAFSDLAATIQLAKGEAGVCHYGDDNVPFVVMASISS